MRLPKTIPVLLCISLGSLSQGQTVPNQTVVRLTESAYHAYLSHPATYFGYKVIDRIPRLRSLLLSTPGLLSPVQFRAAPGVQSAEENQRLELCFTPNDSMFAQQWSLSKINMPLAWKLARGTVATPVAIVDTGINYTHPDLTATYQAGGYDFINADNDPMDDFGHGSLVSGIISAATNNGVGVSGIGFGCPLIGIKVIDGGGSGTSFGLAQGITYAVDNTNARVINLSLGFTAPDANVETACQHATDSGVVVVAAAGNGSTTSPFYPGYYKTTVCVGATDQTDSRWSGSNYGTNWVRVAAPGKDIVSTNLGSNYGGISGTSMAAPAVSGLAALLYERLGPGRSKDKAAWVRSWIYSGAIDVANWTTFGRIDASESLRFARNVAPVSFTWNQYNSSQPDNAFESCSDTAGNVYFASSTGSGIGINIVIEKRDSLGVLVWKKTLDGAGYEDKVTRITVEPDGKIYLVGYSYKDPTSTDGLVACYTSAGALAWKKLIDGTSHLSDWARSLVIAGDKIYVAGATTINATVLSDAAVWTLKKSDGSLLSTATFNGPGNKDDYAEDIVKRSDGKAYVAVTGRTSTDRNAYVCLFNPVTNSISALAGYNYMNGAQDYAVSLRLLSNNDVLFAGTSVAVSGVNQALLARVRSTGGFAWTRSIAGELKSMTTDSQENVYWCGGEVRTPQSRSIVVGQLETNLGSTIWQRRIGGLGDTINSQYDNTGVKCAISGGSLIVTSTTTGQTKFDTTTLWFNSLTGKILRVGRYDAGNVNDRASTLVVSPTSKNVFVGCISEQASGSQARVLKYAP